MTSKDSFSCLPFEVLLKIFEYCDTPSLCRLARTCKFFNEIIRTEDCVWENKARYAVCSNSYALAMRQRCRVELSPKKKCMVSLFWERGKMQRTLRKYCYNETMPSLVLQKNDVFASAGNLIFSFKRDKHGNYILVRGHSHEYRRDYEVTKLIVDGDYVINAFTNGLISFSVKYTLSHLRFIRAHEGSIYCLDAKENILLTGSRDKSLKIWRKNLPYGIELARSIDLGVRVLSTAIVPASNFTVVGLPGTDNIHPLQLFDLKTSQHVTNFGEVFRNGAGYLDIYPEDENTFLCGGYESNVQLWDIRSPRACVLSWSEPWDNSIYCVRSDHHTSIISGSSRNLIHLWDKRVPRFNKQEYLFSKYTSPVYSVGFDSTQLYAAFSRHMVEFSFLKCMCDHVSSYPPYPY